LIADAGMGSGAKRDIGIAVNQLAALGVESLRIESKRVWKIFWVTMMITGNLGKYIIK
jgi:hypothetical protein